MDMYNHRTRQSILVGIPVAFFSEMRVALSVLGDPKFKFGSCHQCFTTTARRWVSTIGYNTIWGCPSNECSFQSMLVYWQEAVARDDKWKDIEFNPSYFFHRCALGDCPNFSNLAFMLLILTVLNVLFVSIGGTLMIRVKEVLPVEKKVFWSVYW